MNFYTNISSSYCSAPSAIAASASSYISNNTNSTKFNTQLQSVNLQELLKHHGININYIETSAFVSNSINSINSSNNENKNKIEEQKENK